MKNFIKLFSVTIISLLALAGCGNKAQTTTTPSPTTPVNTSNNKTEITTYMDKATAAYTALTDKILEISDASSTELDKDEPDVTKFEAWNKETADILDKTTKTIDGLTAPGAEGIKELKAAFSEFFTATQALITAEEDWIKAFKARSSEGVLTTGHAVAEATRTLGKLDGPVQLAIQDVYNANGISVGE